MNRGRVCDEGWGAKRGRGVALGRRTLHVKENRGHQSTARDQSATGKNMETNTT